MPGLHEGAEKAPEARRQAQKAARKAMASRNAPTDKALRPRPKRQRSGSPDDPSAYANAWLVQEYKKRGGTYTTQSSKPKSRRPQEKENLGAASGGHPAEKY